MESLKVDFRIQADILNQLNKVIQKENEKSNNANKSNLLDIGLTVIFSNPAMKDTIETSENTYKNRPIKEYPRTTFTLHNPIAIKELEALQRFDKGMYVETALLYVIEKLEAGQFKELMIEYINAGGVLI
ncbi:MAG: hypothetical protein IKT40_09135 [Bacilli bacterium]|nr:hypothetical protein [Bacilli bacterium]